MSHTLLAGTDTAAGLWTAGARRAPDGLRRSGSGKVGVPPFKRSGDVTKADMADMRAVTSRRAGRMRRTRIEKPRRPARSRRYADEMSATVESLDPRDPDIVRAKRLRLGLREPDATGEA
ncbi:hypothetical protein GCM10010297_08550 [Streptomyces malachitofuscus]|nr:hypothetical protein GCM10010297_08550 [Streptomyces malachitofuscus]